MRLKVLLAIAWFAVSALTLVPTGAAAQTDNTRMCLAAMRKIAPPSGQSYGAFFGSLLRDTAGVSGPTDTATSRRGVRAWYLREVGKPSDQSALYCGDLAYGRNNIFYLSAISTVDPFTLFAAGSAGVPFNAVGRDGKTILDHLSSAAEFPKQLENRYRDPGSPIGMAKKLEDIANLFRRIYSARSASELAFAECSGVPPVATSPNVRFDGKTHDKVGPLPDVIPGVVTVSAQQAACLSTLSDAPIIAAMDEYWGLPNHVSLPKLGASGIIGQENDALIPQYLWDRTRPVLIYCHHEQCHLSYNAVLRLKAAGFTHIYWFRGGTREWLAAGYHLVR